MISSARCTCCPQASVSFCPIARATTSSEPPGGKGTIIVTGRVVRSRVKGLVNGALRYDAALVLDDVEALPGRVLTR